MIKNIIMRLMQDDFDKALYKKNKFARKLHRTVYSWEDFFLDLIAIK